MKENDNEEQILNTEKISQYVKNKIPKDTSFSIPFIHPEQVINYINRLECSKASGLGGIWPRILKIAASSFYPSIAKLINKSKATGCFLLSQSKQWFCQSLNVERNQARRTIDQYPSCLQYQRFWKNM